VIAKHINVTMIPVINPDSLYAQGRVTNPDPTNPFQIPKMIVNELSVPTGSSFFLKSVNSSAGNNFLNSSKGKLSSLDLSSSDIVD